MSYFCKKWHVFLKKWRFLWKTYRNCPRHSAARRIIPLLFQEGVPEGRGSCKKIKKILRKIPFPYLKSLIQKTAYFNTFVVSSSKTDLFSVKNCNFYLVVNQ